MRILSLTFFPPRAYVLGRRVHHGLLGLLLLAHDRRDWRRWVGDFLAHPKAPR